MRVEEDVRVGFVRAVVLEQVVGLCVDVSFDRVDCERCL